MISKKLLVTSICALSIFAVGYFFISKTLSQEPANLKSRKTVEDYFVEHMRVDYEEAKTMAADGIILRLSQNSTLQGVTGNLYYYGFIADEAKFEKLLEGFPDKTSGNKDSIKAGNNTIDVSSSYYLNYNMTDREIADALLNKARFEPDFNEYNYLFMPSGPEKL